jgi:hypothetical protein
VCSYIRVVLYVLTLESCIVCPYIRVVLYVLTLELYCVLTLEFYFSVLTLENCIVCPYIKELYCVSLH